MSLFDKFCGVTLMVLGAINSGLGGFSLAQAVITGDMAWLVDFVLGLGTGVLFIGFGTAILEERF